MSNFAKRDFAFDVKSIESNGKFVGYGSVFDELDSQREVVLKGAFADSIKAMNDLGRKLPILWQHDWASPIGVYDSIKEDDRGLRMEGQLLVADVLQAKEAAALVKAGAVTGLSIGYVVREDSVDEEERIRKLKRVDLKETSLVTFPSCDSARVESIKQVQRALNGGELPSLKQFERLLSDSGFTRKQAAEIATLGLKPLLVRDSDQKGDGSSLILTNVLDSFKIPTFN